MKKTYIILCFPLLIFLKSCSPDPKCGEDITYQYLSDYELKKIPYKDFSILTFINTTTKDTSTFIGEGFGNDYSTYIQSGDCPQTFKLQRRYIVFSCTKNSDKITIQNTFIQPGSSTINFSYKKNNLNISPAGIRKPFSFDSLKIEEKYFYNINQYNPNSPTVSLGILYNTKEGIIQLIHPPTKDTLNLVKLEL